MLRYLDRHQALALAILAILAFAPGCPRVATAEEGHDFAKPFLVGSVLVFAPMGFDGGGLTWGHAIELEGFTYAATDLGFRFLPEEISFLSPVIMTGLVFAYRLPEMGLGRDDLIWRKVGADLLGVVCRVVIEL
jgi:hypothetical protein